MRAINKENEVNSKVVPTLGKTPYSPLRKVSKSKIAHKDPPKEEKLTITELPDDDKETVESLTKQLREAQETIANMTIDLESQLKIQPKRIRQIMMLSQELENYKSLYTKEQEENAILRAELSRLNTGKEFDAPQM